VNGHDFANATLREFCLGLASRTPTPGGGAVAAVTAAHAAGLIAMVVAYSRGKRVFAEFEEEGEAIETSLRLAIERALAAARADADAYAALNALGTLPADDPRRLAGFAAAVEAAIAAPMLVVTLAGELAARTRDLAGRTAKALDSDLAIAADLALAAARAAAWNVRVNLPSLATEEERLERGHVLERALTRIAEDVAHVAALLAARR
jgi:formiminotetrahydrofolate cyclodeaminase